MHGPEHTVSMRRVALSHAGPVVPEAFVLPFDTGVFHPGDFALHGIAPPDGVRRSVPKRQAEYLAGRRAALAALHAVGSDASDVPIGMDRAPRWPTGFIGSVSHTDDIAVATALPTDAGYTGIGLDVEREIADDVLGSVRELVLDAAEEDRLSPFAALHGWPVAMAVAFSAKESFYKATAATVGRFFDFDALRIVEAPPGAAHLEAEVVATLAGDIGAGRRFVLPWMRLDERTVLTSCAW
ncbi:enterobactin synthetase component D [Luteibacter sp. UNCMF331Sha3.1]|nr:enterobactin synthetase component D [Luteibacter sp. UNCMF331Sha3.1]